MGHGSFLAIHSMEGKTQAKHKVTTFFNIRLMLYIYRDIIMIMIGSHRNFLEDTQYISTFLLVLQRVVNNSYLTI